MIFQFSKLSPKLSPFGWDTLYMMEKVTFKVINSINSCHAAWNSIESKWITKQRKILLMNSPFVYSSLMPLKWKELLFSMIGTKCCSFTLAAVLVHTFVVWVPTTNLPHLSSTHDDDRGGFHNDERPHRYTKVRFDKILFSNNIAKCSYRTILWTYAALLLMLSL